MPTGTPNLERIKAAVSAEFPHARFGQYNCRHIGSNPMRSWSQHAGSEPDRGYFGNAVDIWHVDHKPPGKPPDSSPTHQAWLRKVRAFITLHFGDLIDQMLGPGDNAAHANHLHTSPFPKMKSNWWYRPPCKGGTLIVIHEDGSTGDTFGASSMEANMLQTGSQGKAVGFYQEALIARDPNALPRWGADDDYGPETTEWVNRFAADFDLAQTGVIDGVLADLLGAFHPDRAAGKGDKGDDGTDGVDGVDGKDGDPGPDPTSATFGYD